MCILKHVYLPFSTMDRRLEENGWQLKDASCSRPGRLAFFRRGLSSPVVEVYAYVCNIGYLYFPVPLGKADQFLFNTCPAWKNDKCILTQTQWYQTLKSDFKQNSANVIYKIFFIKSIRRVMKEDCLFHTLLKLFPHTCRGADVNELVFTLPTEKFSILWRNFA